LNLTRSRVEGNVGAANTSILKLFEPSPSALSLINFTTSKQTKKKTEEK